MGNRRFLLVLLFGIAALTAPVYGASGAAFVNQTPLLTQYEAQVVYYTNLARADNGRPPLRWNRELTNSARWFAWDSVENRADVYCGHEDTNGEGPQDRNVANGYYGEVSGAENAYCGFILPEDAVDGWMASYYHRLNLLDTNFRELGVGYYQRASDGRGYEVQDFGTDSAYPPAVINNEALNTTKSRVDLYIYSSSGGGFDAAGPATQMRLSNTPCFDGVPWQNYAESISWDLIPGDGWRTVYVQTRDAFGRYFTVSDTIYHGTSAPTAELGEAQMSQTHQSVTLYNQPPAGTTAMQYSLGWAADDSYQNFSKLWGNGVSVSDPDAWGGTAYRMYDGAGETRVWVWTTMFYSNVPMVAYFRLKVSDNTSPNSVSRISVEGGSAPAIERVLRGVDFQAAGEYQEFAIPFTYVPGEDNLIFLTFNIWRAGAADVYFDAVTIFTASQSLPSPLAMQFTPPTRYRGQTLWLRWLNASGQFSEMEEGITISPNLAVSPLSVTFLAAPGVLTPSQATLALVQLCGNETVSFSGKPSWLNVTLQPGSALLVPSASGLSPGTYDATLTFTIPSRPQSSPVPVNVRLVVAAQLTPFYLPVILH